MPAATVEIGHVYAPDRLVDLARSDESGDFYSARLGRAFNDTAEAARLRKIADDVGESAIRVALIDDVVAKEKMKVSEEPWRWQQFLNVCYESIRLGTGVEQSNLFYETDFEQRGRDIVAYIQTTELPREYRLSQSHHKLTAGSGSNRTQIPLTGFEGVEDPTFPSCQVLDIAWLEKRLTLAPKAITVLPASYQEQQRGVGVLAGLMGIDSSSHATVFYNP